ncbi:MAG TPA: hypothetical protein VHP58_01795 [Alphaproteobacteria bacterium]|nr:hypothetical protein [Alphaproteobacteria bacterium]
MPKLLMMAALAVSSTSLLDTPSTANCKRVGCNGEQCVSAASSIPLKTGLECTPTAQSICYQYSTCASTGVGTCGWQANDTFNKCLKMAGEGTIDKIPSAQIDPSVTSKPAPAFDYNKVGQTVK